MVYFLACPDCQAVNEVESDETVREWACRFCKARAVSSLPTDEDGNLAEQVT